MKYQVRRSDIQGKERIEDEEGEFSESSSKGCEDIEEQLDEDEASDDISPKTYEIVEDEGENQIKIAEGLQYEL